MLVKVMSSLRPLAVQHEVGVADEVEKRLAVTFAVSQRA
jgi:hypothetical protein